MGRHPIDDDEVQVRMLPPADRGALIRESVALVAWCLGLTAALFLVVYLLT